MTAFGPSPNAGGSTVGLKRIGATANRREPVIVGAACFAAAASLLGAHVYALEVVIAASAMLLSTDGIVEAANRSAVSAALLSAAAIATLAGSVSLARAIPAWRVVIDAIVNWDSLRHLGLAVPNAYLVQVTSVALGVLFIGTHLIGSGLEGPLRLLFRRREGFLELLTVALELVAVFWCVGAARYWNRAGKHVTRAVPVLYGTLAVVLFLVAMEELNWGQTLLAFETPSAWAAINYQQETSLHNLLDGPTLIMVERGLVGLFGLGVFALMALAVKWPRSVFAAIAPPASLGALAALCAVPGAYLRLEVTELLLAIFFAFYSYRIFVAARSRVVLP
jgi:hypothetical protein